jgi:hypothetical protein
VDTTRTTRSGQFILNSSMPRERVGVVGSPMIEHDNGARNVSVNSRPQASPIFRLPLEIRRIIYNFVISERILDNVNVLRSCSEVRSPKKIRPNTRKALLEFRSKPSPLAIAATCQQLYHEAVKVWYGNARFYFYTAPCTRMFLEAIGDSNRDMIRYASCSIRGGPADMTKGIIDIVSTFANLRSLILEEVGNVSCMGHARASDLKNAEKSWEIWEEEARHRLKLMDRLESVILRTKWTNIRTINQRICAIPTWSVRDFKMNRCTGEITTTTTYDDGMR